MSRNSVDYQAALRHISLKANMTQMDCRLRAVPGLVCGRNGTDELRLPSTFRTKTAVYCSILWFYSTHASLCAQGELSTTKKRPARHTNCSQLHSTILTLFAALIQLAALAWYLVSYFPMGSSGLRFATNFGARQATAWMSG